MARKMAKNLEVSVDCGTSLDYFHYKIADLRTKILGLRSNLHDPTNAMNEVIEEIPSALEELDVAKREIFRQNRNLQIEVNPVRLSWMSRPAALNFVRDIARNNAAEDTMHLRGYDAINEVFLMHVFQEQGNVYPILYSLEERGAYENSCCG
ncbi:Uncharacterised protein [uncultured archaeon]|nr:Uncharacterised protein [uncultured archaeon]